MKKLIWLTAILLVFTCLLASCTSGETKDTEESQADSSGVATEANGEMSSVAENTEALSSDSNADLPSDEELNIVRDPHGSSPSGHFDYTVDDIPNEYFFDPDIALAETLPVYTYSYGFGEGGNFYTLTDDDRKILEERMTDFMAVRYGEEADAFSYINNEYTIKCEAENEIIYSSINSATVAPQKNIVGLDEFAKDPLGNDIVQDFIEYLDMKEPVAVRFTRDGAEDTAMVNYYIADIAAHTDNDIEYICVDFQYGKMVRCKSTEVKFGEKHGEYNTVPYDVALAQIKSEYPELDTESAKAMTYMRFEYQQVIGADGSYGGNGYYSPCYRFFLKNTDPSVEGLTMIDVSMTDFKPGETITLGVE